MFLQHILIFSEIVVVTESLFMVVTPSADSGSKAINGSAQMSPERFLLLTVLLSFFIFGTSWLGNTVIL